MRTKITPLLMLAVFALAGCKGEKKMVQYSELYQERPATVYVAPINDRSERRAVRSIEDSVYNAAVNTATKQLYLTASDPLVYNGYYVLGPMASAQLAASDSRTFKQLRNENINDYYTDLGIDAILMMTVTRWSSTFNTWTVEVEYTMRSTRTGSEVLHTVVCATKMLRTDFKGNPIPLREDEEFAKRYGCDLETAQRCRLVEVLNQFVLSDLPTGSRVREYSLERFIPSHAEYYNLNINPDGSVMIVPSDDVE